MPLNAPRLTTVPRGEFASVEAGLSPFRSAVPFEPGAGAVKAMAPQASRCDG